MATASHIHNTMRYIAHGLVFPQETEQLHFIGNNSNSKDLSKKHSQSFLEQHNNNYECNS
jgi:hypothetical protein